MTVSQYDRCVAKCSDGLYRFALKSLRDEEQAKDIVQESFLRLWENREAVVEGKEKSYLFTVAYRLIVDDIRFRRRYTSDEALQKVRGDENGYSDLSEIVRKLIDRLPLQQRTLIMLRDYEGYSYREMARMTSLSEAQVKVYIFRARTALKNGIGKLNDVL